MTLLVGLSDSISSPVSSTGLSNSRGSPGCGGVLSLRDD